MSLFCAQGRRGPLSPARVRSVSATHSLGGVGGVTSAVVCSLSKHLFSAVACTGCGLDSGGTGTAKGFVLSHSHSAEQVCQPGAGGELSSNGAKLHTLYEGIRFSGNGVCGFRQIFRGFCGPTGAGCLY